MAQSITGIQDHLVNGSTGDPQVWVELPSQNRNLILDCGFSPRFGRDDYRAITDILISHTHLDHWIGFDAVVRMNYNDSRTIRVYGPPGMIEMVGHRLRGYTWNLAPTQELLFVVLELGDGWRRRATFSAVDRFHRGEITYEPDIGPIIDLPDIDVTYTTLDHKIPSLAFSVSERPRLNIDGEKMKAMGLRGGPWCRLLKTVAESGGPLEGTLRVDDQQTIPIRDLLDNLTTWREGYKLTYVTDTAPSPTNIGRIIRLARGADRLYIEGFYLARDRELAEKHHHLTAAAAAQIARDAEVGEVVLMHFSKRYDEKMYSHILEEARAIFPETKAFFRGVTN